MSYPAQSGRSCLEEDLVEVPFQELAARPVSPMLRQVDDLPSLGVELIAVAEVGPQARADQQAVLPRLGVTDGGGRAEIWRARSAWDRDAKQPVDLAIRRARTGILCRVDWWSLQPTEPILPPPIIVISRIARLRYQRRSVLGGADGGGDAWMRRQPPARLFAMTARNIASRAERLIASPR